MPVTESTKAYTCHCLKAHVSALHLLQAEDIFTFNHEEVLRHMLAKWPDRRFHNVGFEAFRVFYLEASNEIATRNMEAAGFSRDEMKEAIARRMCGGCGFHAYRELRDNPHILDKLEIREAA